MRPAVKAGARASVDVSIIAQRFNYEWATDPENGVEEDTYWWWACSVRVDPDEVIADDAEGNLWSIPFTTDGEDTVTFGTPVRVRETFVPVAAADGVAATAVVSRRSQRVLASQLAKPEKPARDNPAAARPQQEEEPVPLDIAALRSRLGLSDEQLPDDATEEQINAALAVEPETTEVENSEAEPETETTETGTAASERTVTLDRSQYEQLTRNAEAGATARREQLSAALDVEADAAVKDGRITPASRAEWRAAIDPGENPDAAATARAEAEKTALASLTPGRVPVTGERGKQNGPSDGEESLMAATRSRLGIKTPQEA